MKKNSLSKKNRKVYRRANPRQSQPLLTFPDHIDIKLKYSQVLSFTSPTVSETNYRFRGNGLYACMVTGETGQPWGYDQWSAMYERYMVSGVDADVQLVNSSNNPLQLVLNYQIDTSYNSVDSVTSQPYCVWSLIAPTSGFSKSSVRLGVRTEEILQVKPLHTGMDDYIGVTGDTGSNPNRLFYGTVYIKTLNGIIQGAAGSHAVLTLTYTVRFFRRRDVGPS